jgi:energy-coupling factor transporter ATP-binding protein EcfA2
MALDWNNFPDFRLGHIEINANYPFPNELIFEWEFKDMNFLFGINDAWKTTLFHILKDIMWNPNSGWAGVSWFSILTEDLLLRNLEVTLYFSIWGHKFFTRKWYWPNGIQRFFLEEPYLYVGSKDTFMNYLEEKDILQIPHIKYKNKEKLTLFSIMRLCFIEQDGGFGIKNKVSKHKNSASIIRHSNDGRTKILFYAYVLSIVWNESQLNYLYNELGKLSEVDNELEWVMRNLKILSWENTVNEEWGLFDIISLVRTIQSLNHKKRKIDIANFNYQKIIERFEQLIQYSRWSEEDNKNYRAYVIMLERDMGDIQEKIIANNELINQINLQIDEKEKLIKAWEDFILDEFLMKMKNLSPDSWEQGLFQSLRIKEQELRAVRADLVVTFDKIKEQIYANDNYKAYYSFVVAANKNYFSDEETVSLSLDEGRYYFSTTADSMNRIALFNILTSFLFLKKKLNVQHPNFIIFDSPFVWMNKDNEALAISNFIELYENILPTSQFFIFLNPEDFNEELLNKIQGKDYTSIHKSNSKLFT